MSLFQHLKSCELRIKQIIKLLVLNADPLIKLDSNYRKSITPTGALGASCDNTEYHPRLSTSLGCCTHEMATDGDSESEVKTSLSKRALQGKESIYLPQEHLERQED